MTRRVVQLPIWLVAAGMAAFIALMSLLGWQVGEVLERMDRRAEARAVEVEEIHADLDALKADIREEIRNPAGPRGDAHAAARAAVEGLRRIEERLDRLIEHHGIEPDD